MLLGARVLSVKNGTCKYGRGKTGDNVVGGGLQLYVLL